MFKVGDKVKCVRVGAHLDVLGLREFADKERVVVEIGDNASPIYKGLIRTAFADYPYDPFGKGRIWWHSAECCDIIPVPVGDKEWKEVKAEVKLKRVRKPKVEWVPITKDNYPNVGDEMLCVPQQGNKGNDITDGKIYKLKKVAYDAPDAVWLDTDNALMQWILSHRFHVKSVPVKKDKAVKKAAIMKPKKEKSPFKFDIGDRVKVVGPALEYEDEPHGGPIGKRGYEEAGRSIHTISQREINDKYTHPGYKFEGVVNAFDYIWDERSLKRVRKAKAKNVIKDVIKAAKAKVRVKKEPKPVGYEMVVCTFENTKVGDKVVAVNVEGHQKPKLGETYTVSAVRQRNAGIHVLEFPDTAFYFHRFAHKRVKELVPKRRVPKVVEHIPCSPENSPVGTKLLCINDYIHGYKHIVKGEIFTVTDGPYCNHKDVTYVYVDSYLANGNRHQGGAGYYRKDFVLWKPGITAEPAIIAKAPEKEKLNTASHHYDLLAGLAKAADARAGTCSYAIKFQDGHIEYHAPDVCHLRLGGQGGHGQRIAVGLNIKGHYVNMKEENKPRYLRYVNYVINESPFKNVFLSRGVDHALKHGILMNVERPIEEIAGAAITLRQVSEYWQARLKFFCDLLDKGYSGNTAYLLMYAVNDKQQFFGFDDGHRSIAQNCNADDVIKTFRDGYHLTGALTAYNKSSRGYEGVAKWIGRREGKSITEFFREGLKAGKMGGGAGWGADAGGDKVTDENLYAFADKLELLVNKIV